VAIPTGEIVDRPMLARSCGCIQEFQVFKVDKYLAQRRAKFQSTRCPACVAKYREEQRKTDPPKNEAFARLPAGTVGTLTRPPDGSWAGTLSADGASVQATESEPQALTVVLARLWLAQRPPDAK
jgi:hypothetical protein